MGYSRKWLADTLRRLGYEQAADEALRVLPDQIDRQQLREFGDRHGISRDTLIDRMGGSPWWVNPSEPASRSWPSSRTGGVGVLAMPAWVAGAPEAAPCRIGSARC